MDAELLIDPIVPVPALDVALKAMSDVLEIPVAPVFPTASLGVSVMVSVFPEETVEALRASVDWLRL